MSASIAACSKTRGATYFLFGLQALDNRCELGEDLVGLLVVLDLSVDKLGEVAKGLRGIQNLYLLVMTPIPKGG